MTYLTRTLMMEEAPKETAEIHIRAFGRGQSANLL